MNWTVIRPSTFLGFFLAWFILGVICVGCWRILFRKRESKVLCFMLFWAVIFWFPQSGIFPINAFIAEHFIYLSSISFFVLVVYLLNRYLRKELFILSMIALVMSYGLLTFSRNAEWQDPVVFYEKNIRYSPDSFLSHNNLGTEYEYRHHMYQKAIFEYKRALEIKPGLIEARSNLANIYFKAGRFEDSRREYELIKKSAPLLKLGEIENNIGCIYEVEGLWSKALESYALALKLDPKLNFTHFNIAKIYQAQGKLQLSAKEILDSIPEITDSFKKKYDYTSLINKYLKSVKLTAAVRLYNDLGIYFAAQGLFQEAVFSFKRSLELEPFYADAYFNLGLAYWHLGLKKEALSAIKKALKINPNHLRAKGFLSEFIYKK
jgi:tetratricopeptide (TPR) repeat protein